MMIIRSNALEDVFDEYGEKKMLARFREIVESGGGGEAPLLASYPVELLMYISQSEGSTRALRI